jgi:ethanolamine utilization protein EutA
MHDLELDHEHGELSEQDRQEIARAIWSQETVELTTVGIDIGSSTSHLLFAKVTLQRRSQGLSSRFVVTARDAIWRSPIMLTPFLPDGAIDAASLGAFIRESYAKAGLTKCDVDSGAVILTGEAIKRRNARAIDQLFADEAGKFVCATAGHKLECLLAAHGSGATAYSKDRATCVLHVDIGGGTTKLALIDKGNVLGVCAFAVGGRALAADSAGVWTRVDDSARLIAQALGISVDPEALFELAPRWAIAREFARIAADFVTGAPLDERGRALLLTDPLPEGPRPAAFTFSGGVSEYIFGRERREFGDIAKPLAHALREELASRFDLPLVDPGQGIRATVIGASQFSVQVSGKTIHLSGVEALPTRDLPVVRLRADLARADDAGLAAVSIEADVRRLDLEPDARLALAFEWSGDPHYDRLARAAKAIMTALAPAGRRSHLLALMIDGDVGRTLGRLLEHECGLEGPFISIDGVQLQDLDYVDIGAPIDPPGVVPVVIKSLLFSNGADNP